MSGLFEELKRRNVFRVGLAYLVAGWLLLQIVDVIGPILHISDEVARYVLFFVAIGFLPALVIAWVFEWTPEGVKFESEVDRARSIAPRTARKLDRAIIVILLLAVCFLLFDKLALDSKAPEPASTVQIEAPGPGLEVAGAQAAMPDARTTPGQNAARWNSGGFASPWAGVLDRSTRFGTPSTVTAIPSRFPRRSFSMSSIFIG